MKKKTLNISVSTVDEFGDRLMEAFADKKHEHRIAFVSLNLLWKTLTGKRWEIIQAMKGGGGAMTFREIARRVDRDVKSVHADVQALLKAGILERTEDGRTVFPYDDVHVDFRLSKVA